MINEKEEKSTIDLIWGATAIAKEINRTERQTFHLLENGELPARKIGNRWVADRSLIRSLFLGEAA